MASARRRAGGMAERHDYTVRTVQTPTVPDDLISPPRLWPPPPSSGTSPPPWAEPGGRVTAEPVWATGSSPAFDAAGMDGIAVRAAETAGASDTTPLLLHADAFAVVDTGDPLPEGFDAVVMREQVHR